MDDIRFNCNRDVALFDDPVEDPAVPVVELDTQALKYQEQLLFYGHRLPGSTTEDSAASDIMRQENSPFVPECVDGTFTVQTSNGQSFAETQSVLTQGMCGGAVMKPNMVDCVGMIEGVVSNSGPEPLVGQAAFIPASELLNLIMDEQGEMVQFGTGLLE